MTFHVTEGATLKVVEPGAGRHGRLGPGVGVDFKIDGADTSGAVAIVEHPFAVGALVRPHVHTREDEISIVLEVGSVSDPRIRKSCWIGAAIS